MIDLLINKLTLHITAENCLSREIIMVKPIYFTYLLYYVVLCISGW